MLALGMIRSLPKTARRWPGPGEKPCPWEGWMSAWGWGRKLLGLWEQECSRAGILGLCWKGSRSSAFREAWARGREGQEAQPCCFFLKKEAGRWLGSQNELERLASFSWVLS